MARPTLYNETIANKICEEIVKGKSLHTICKPKGMPCVATIYRWLDHPDNQAFVEKYTRAKQDQAESGFERIMDIVDKVEAGTLDPNQGRVMIDAIKWQLGKLRPSKYSDKIQIDQDTNITIEVLNYANRKAIPVSGSAKSIDE